MAALATRAGRRIKNDKDRSIEIACRRYSERALKVLVDVLDDETADIRWRIQAAKEILDRGHGRPKQVVDSNITVEGGDALVQAIQAGRARVMAAVAVEVSPPAIEDVRDEEAREEVIYEHEALPPPVDVKVPELTEQMRPMSLIGKANEANLKQAPVSKPLNGFGLG